MQQLAARGLVVFALIAVLAAGVYHLGWLPFFRPPTIQSIVADSDRLNGKEISLRAQVREGGDLFGRGAYELDDGTGRIWVLTQQGAPTVGRTVLVKARVNRVLQIPAAAQRLFGLPTAQLVGLEEVSRR